MLAEGCPRNWGNSTESEVKRMGEMQPFEFKHSTRVVFGAGTLKTLGEEAQALCASRALIVCDPGITKLGLTERVDDQLGAAAVRAVSFDAISENPRDGECCAAAAVATEEGADLIVGLGGGSAMDAAKAAAALVTNGGRVKDWEDSHELVRQSLPLLCIPTTAGTGSEVTFVAVITDEVNHHKMTLRGPGLAPRVAIVDAELTASMPPTLTASTGMDALSHAIEAYTCTAANPVSDVLALKAIELIARNLPTAVRDGADLRARSAMVLASTMAGMAFANSRVGAVHSIGEVLGGLYDTPHGVAVAVFLPHIYAFNIAAAPERHRDVARALGVVSTGGRDSEVAEQGAEVLFRLTSEVGIPALAELPGVSPGDFEQLAETAAGSSCSQVNPRTIDEDDYLAILHDAYGSRTASDVGE